MKQKLIRLKDLTVPDVQEDLRILLTRQTNLFCRVLDNHVEPELSKKTEALVSKVLCYAQTGIPKHAPTHCWEILNRVLYSSTIEFSDEATLLLPEGSTLLGLEVVPPPVQPRWRALDKDPTYSIECAMRAARARRGIDKNEDIPVGWLATLASLPIATLRVYASRGDLKTKEGDPGKVSAAQARAWLKKRGVPGF